MAHIGPTISVHLHLLVLDAHETEWQPDNLSHGGLHPVPRPLQANASVGGTLRVSLILLILGLKSNCSSVHHPVAKLQGYYLMASSRILRLFVVLVTVTAVAVLHRTFTRGKRYKMGITRSDR
ncbi:hypothetical protein L1987_15964 [Smallanthus sonchifolius]|uniref:Uncharacterized protein n=1 Tax=Smallanthus sonchifolius TaxID=185202 RepID=A0ACB9J978_9ASTR|nr:hypothetical protein L1987_15964 [Smallanthus sonchifolius]